MWLLTLAHPMDPGVHEPIRKFGVILQEGDYFRNHETVCVVLLTTVPRRSPRRTDVRIPPDEHGEADKVVWAICHEVYPVPVEDLMEYRYSLSADTMRQIDRALVIGLGMV